MDFACKAYDSISKVRQSFLAIDVMDPTAVLLSCSVIFLSILDRELI